MSSFVRRSDEAKNTIWYFVTYIYKPDIRTLAPTKVSKSRKQILKFSFEPKNERKHFCISGLASKKRSNQKDKSTNWRIFLALLHYFFDLTSFYRLGQKYRNIFVLFLVQMKTLKFAFEIYWPVTQTGNSKSSCEIFCS